MGYKIREFREKAGMSQEELAEKSGISRVTISKLETGGSTTTTKTLCSIAAALGVPVNKIFFDESVNRS